MNIKISIVVPVYNAEKYLDECITSILNQTYNNFELILINDGSIDNSLEICNKYSLGDNRIKVINKINEGVSRARNIGIEVSTGDYLMFVDSDDTIQKNSLDIIVDNIKKYSSDILIFGLAHYNFYNESIISSSIRMWNEEAILSIDDFKNNFRFLFNTLDLFSSCNKCFNLHTIKKNNIRFDEEVVVYEDFLFNINVFEVIDTISNIPSVLYNYRKIVANNSLLKRKKDNLFMDISKVIKNLLDFINEDIKYFKELNQFIFRLYDMSITKYLYNSKNKSIKQNIEFLIMIKNSKWFHIFESESYYISIKYRIFNKMINLRMYNIAYRFLVKVNRI